MIVASFHGLIDHKDRYKLLHLSASFLVGKEKIDTISKYLIVIVGVLLRKVGIGGDFLTDHKYHA